MVRPDSPQGTEKKFFRIPGIHENRPEEGRGQGRKLVLPSRGLHLIQYDPNWQVRFFYKCGENDFQPILMLLEVESLRLGQVTFRKNYEYAHIHVHVVSISGKGGHGFEGEQTGYV